MTIPIDTNCIFAIHPVEYAKSWEEAKTIIAEYMEAGWYLLDRVEAYGEISMVFRKEII